jgi:hypothetical protein
MSARARDMREHDKRPSSAQNPKDDSMRNLKLEMENEKQKTNSKTVLIYCGLHWTKCFLFPFMVLACQIKVWPYYF